MDHNQPQRPTGMPQSMRPQQPQHTAQNHAAPSPPPKKSKGLFIVGVIALVLIAVTLAGAGIMRIMGDLNTYAAVNSSKYQAVFLNNNMVYFGKMTQVNDQYIKMTDVFYLQVAGQQTDQKAQTQQQGQNQQLSLTKLGGELHGPEDAMYINKKEILFWENLKADGKVTQAIKDYRSKNSSK